jgi:hypothetical protein
MYLTFIKNKISVLTLIVGTVLTFMVIVVAGVPINPIQAETGKGEDVFKVIMTVLGVHESKGDMVAIVTVNNEASKVKFFDAEGPYVIPLNPLNSSEGGGHFIEYVATFPNVTVNAGDMYKACVMTIKDLELICSTGQNSPAARPEFVDISLNVSSAEETSALEVEDDDENDE